MIDYQKWIAFASVLLFASMAKSDARPAQTPASSTAANTGREARTTLSHDLPRLDGAHLRVTIVEVTYRPGGSSPTHSHPCPVIGYVAEGALRMHFQGQPETIYKAGESFYEAANGVHLVSANAGDKEPAKLIAYFVCDHETPLSVPVPEGKSGEEK
jgi:quercetin dioxygenase-like cupin family protein